MIGTPEALGAGCILLVGVLLVLRGKSAARALASAPELALFEEGADIPACPGGFVDRVFSHQDAGYIAAANSTQLTKLFRRERKQVALAWVQQTALIIQRAMDEHRAIARVSRDLEPVTEIKLWFLYYRLMFVCGSLHLAVQALGPGGLRAVATYAHAHSQRLTQVQQSFAAATRASELPRAGAA